MSVFRPLVLLLLLLLALVLVVLSYLHAADLNRHRGAIEAAVTHALGREFRLAGDLDLDLLPEVSLQVDGATLANAAWGSQPQMAEVGHFRARIRPASLLFGPLDVVGVDLFDVVVLVESDAEGNSNWIFTDATSEEPAAEKEGDEAGGLSITLDDVQLHNVVITVRAEGAEEQVYRLEKFEIQTDGEDRMLLSGRGEALTLPLTLSGWAGTRMALAETGAADFDIELALGDLAVELSGNRGAPGSGAGSRMRATAGTQDLAAFLQPLGISSSLARPLAVTADITGSRGRAKADVTGSLGDLATQAVIELHDSRLSVDGRLDSLDRLGALLAVSGLPAAALTFKGEAAVADELLRLEGVSLATGEARLLVDGTLAGADDTSSLQIAASGPSLADLMTTLPVLPFEASTAISLAPGEVRLQSLDARAGSSDLSGSARVLTTETLAIEAALQAKRIDLAELAGDSAPVDDADEAPDTGAAKPAPGAVPAESRNGYVFQDQPLPLDVLQRSDADIRLSVEELVIAAGSLDKLQVVGTLHGGSLEATADFTTAAGGRSSSRIRLDASGEGAELMADIQARDLRINIASGDVKDINDIPPINISADLASSGKTPRSLAANSNGNVLVTLGSGMMDAKLLSRVSGDIVAQLLSALDPFAEKDPRTRFECGVVALDIKDGLSTMDPLMLQSDRLVIVAGGTIDLNTEKLNVEFNTKPRKGVGVSADMFVTPFVSLKGTLASPRIGMNQKGTLIATGTAVATGGISILLKGVADRASGAIDQCKETLPGYQHPPLKVE